MKIYRTRVIARGLTGEQAARMLSRCPGVGIESTGCAKRVRGEYARGYYGLRHYQTWDTVPTFNITRRCEYLREWHLEGKALLKMLPAWAKKCMASSPTIGHKVTAFYALNNKVVTDCSGLVVGSDEYYDWLETQPDPFRSTRNYRQSLGELRA